MQAELSPAWPATTRMKVYWSAWARFTLSVRPSATWKT